MADTNSIGPLLRAPVENQEALLKDLKDRLILLELEKLSETPYYNNKYNKRSDIDSRLLEWQAKIKQLHHLNDRLPGHGKIDFEDM